MSELSDRAALGDPEFDLELLTLIRDQLPCSEADELIFYAFDDPAMFCAVALAKVQSGALVVPPTVKKALHRGLMAG